MLRKLVLLAAAICAAHAQPLTFDAASVKPNHSGSGSHSTHTRSATVYMTNVSLESCIELAYGVKTGQVSGPDWLNSEWFDIVAKAPHEVKSEELMQMMQKLLADRFLLKVHQEERPLPGYALVVDKKGLKIKPVEGTTNHTESENDSFTATEVPFSQFVKNLSRMTGAPVVDETNTEGNFSFTFTWTREQNPAAAPKATAADPPAGPTIFDAVRDLGLRLDARKIPMPVVIVDHVERVPTEN